MLVSVISPVKSEFDRQLFIEEVAHAGETVHSGTVTHVGVESHLRLETGSGSDLMGSLIPSDVILDVKDSVHNLVTISEKLCTQVHVRFLLVTLTQISGKDFHKREESSVITTLVNNIGIGNEQLVGNVIGDTAVKVGRDCIEVVHLVVQRVREDQTVLRKHVERHSGDIP